MTEEEFIEQEVRRYDGILFRQLRKVKVTGRIDHDTAETLEQNDLIRFGGPRDNIPYNCFRLSEKGIETFERLKEKLC